MAKTILALVVALNIATCNAQEVFGPTGEILVPLTCASDGSGAMSRRGRAPTRFNYEDTVRLLPEGVFVFSNVRYDVIERFNFAPSFQFVAVPQISKIGVSLITVSKDGRRLFFANNDLDIGIVRPYSCSVEY